MMIGKLDRRFFSPDDPLPPGDGGGNGPSSLTCEFCDCRISRSGEVLKLGAKAKGFRDSDGQIEKLTDKIAGLEARIVELNSDLEAARAIKPADVPKGRGGFLSDN